MNARVNRWRALIALLTLLVMVVSLGGTPAPTQAEDPDTATPVPGTGGRPMAQPGADPLTPPDTSNDSDAAPSATSRAQADSTLEPAQATKQGFVTLEVSVDTGPSMPNRKLRAGQMITYTYKYHNTSTSFVSGVRLETAWSEFSTSSKGDQYCVDDETDACYPFDVQGPAVFKDEEAGDDLEVPQGIRLTIADMLPGQQGQFKIALHTNPDLYPESEKAQTQLSGSGSLYINNEQVSHSEFTIDATVIGPVFNIEKEPDLVAMGDQDKIYPTDQAHFIIRVGNATADADLGRADAIDAHNVIIKDPVPDGSEFVSSNSPFFQQFDAENNQVIWAIPEMKVATAVGQYVELPVVFRKLDVDESCNRVNNKNYSITSDEMPVDPGADQVQGEPPIRLEVEGKSSSVSVVTPVEITSVKADPSNINPGEESTITIKVENNWREDLNSVEVRYPLQPFVTYIADSADPPVASSSGGILTWDVAMPKAENIETPYVQEFTFKVRGDTVGTEKTEATVVVPTSVPSACIDGKTGGVKVGAPEVEITKEINSEIELEKDSVTKGQVWQIDQNSEVSYVIILENQSPLEITGLEITDQLPLQPSAGWGFADFNYVVGSATSSDPDYDPSNPANFEYITTTKTMVWRNLRLPPEGTVRLNYRATAVADPYFNSCNLVVAKEIDGVEFDYTQSDGSWACAKVNPPLLITKEADREVVYPGDDITFDLTLKNNDNVVHTVSLADFLDPNLEFNASQVFQGYDPAPEYELMEDGLAIWWKMIALQPGQEISVSFVTTVPVNDGKCISRRFINEPWFRYESAVSDTGIYWVEPLDAPDVVVDCTTSTLEYSHKVQNEASLRTRLEYELTLENEDDLNPATNVTVDHILPVGFTYEDMGEKTDVTDEPIIDDTSRPDGRVKLTWNIASIEAGDKIKIVFNGRAGQVVGEFTSWMVASNEGSEGICKSSCELVEEDGQEINYSMDSAEIRAMHTIEPNFIVADRFQGACLAQGTPLIYKLSLVNTYDETDYKDTTVVVTLPLGLQYLGVTENAKGEPTPEPSITTSPSGKTVLTWYDLTIGKPPRNRFVQVDLLVELRVGQVLSSLFAQVYADSPDGMIVPKEQEIDEQFVDICSPDDPQNQDTDGDGMSDQWENQYGLDPNDPSDANGDLDGDGVTNLDEFLLGSDPTDPEDPGSTDTDGDGIPDWWEDQYGLNPNDPDDADGDLDGDGISNLDEYLNDTDPSEPNFPDTDGDGLPDQWEIDNGLDPNDPSDADGDLDGDGASNLDEYEGGTDPTDPTSVPPPAPAYDPNLKVSIIKGFQPINPDGVYAGEELIYSIQVRNDNDVTYTIDVQGKDTDAGIFTFNRMLSADDTGSPVTDTITIDKNPDEQPDSQTRIWRNIELPPDKIISIVYVVDISGNAELKNYETTAEVLEISSTELSGDLNADQLQYRTFVPIDARTVFVPTMKK